MQCSLAPSTDVKKQLAMIRPGMSMLSVFICLRGTKEDLKLQSTNYYVYFDMTKRKMAGVGRLMALGLNPQDHASTLDMVLGVTGGCVLREQVHGLQCTSRKAFYTKAVSVSPCGGVSGSEPSSGCCWWLQRKMA